MSQPHPTPQTYHPLDANPNLTAKEIETENLTKPCILKTPHFIQLRFYAFPRYFTRIWHVMLHPKPSPKASPKVSAIIALYRERLRAVANGCGRYSRYSTTMSANKCLPPDPQS